jgi:hypothetical protein
MCRRHQRAEVGFFPQQLSYAIGWPAVLANMKSNKCSEVDQDWPKTYVLVFFSKFSMMSLECCNVVRNYLTTSSADLQQYIVKPLVVTTEKQMCYFGLFGCHKPRRVKRQVGRTGDTSCTVPVSAVPTTPSRLGICSFDFTVIYIDKVLIVYICCANLKL